MQRAKKFFGQNWLVDASAVKKLVNSAQIVKGEQVLEIGPGTGIITQALLEAGAKVTAVELDHDLIEPLQQKFKDSITLVQGDILRIFESGQLLFSTPFKLVSSIPYNITSDILKLFLSTSNKPEMICLVVQKEVAERITAKPPHMSLLSVVCQVYAKCEYIDTIKAGAFRPIPKVDSAVIRLTLYTNGHPKLYGLGPEKVIRLARLGFSSKRKQLQKNLSSLPLDKRPEDLKSFLEELGIASNIRAENLTVDEWIKMVGKLRTI